MIRIIKQSLRLLLQMMPLVGLAWFTACSSDVEQEVEVPGAPVEVNLQISVDELGDLNSRAEDMSTSHEFIHSLCVLIVNEQGEVESKILPDAATLGSTATTADLRTYYHKTPIKLAAGVKTIYAFANWNTVNNTTWNGIISSGIGDKLSPETVDGIVLDDPAGKVDFAEGKYIPMSAKLTVNVTSSTRHISIGLDRVVSKVRMTVTPDSKDNVTINTLSVKGFADRVSLLAGKAMADVQYNKEQVFALSTEIIAGSKLSLKDFYVNETPNNRMYVTMQTNQFSGMTYAATTERYQLPRNSIYPLNIVFSDYQLVLEPTAWRSPIASEPRPYTVNADGAYVIEMMDVTSKFQIVPAALMCGEERMSDVTWTWIPELTDENRDLITLSQEGDVVVGNFSALAGIDYKIGLNATWTYNQKNFNRTYTVIIRVVDKYMPFNSQSRAESNIFSPEVLNLTIL